MTQIKGKAANLHFGKAVTIKCFYMKNFFQQSSNNKQLISAVQLNLKTTVLLEKYLKT